MKSQRFTLIALYLLLTGLLLAWRSDTVSAATPAATGAAYVRVFYAGNQNAGRDVAEVSLDGAIVFHSVSFGSFTPYLRIAAGDYTVSANASTYPVPADATFQGNNRYTIVVMEGFIYCGGSEETCFTVYKAPPRPAAGLARIRLVMPGKLVDEMSGTLLLSVADTPKDKTMTAPRLAFFCIEHGTMNMVNSDIVTHCLPDMQLQSRERYTVWWMQNAHGDTVPIIYND